jgi:hypothetical protein
MLWQLIHIATISPLLLQFSSVAKAKISSSVDFEDEIIEIETFLPKASVQLFQDCTRD